MLPPRSCITHLLGDGESQLCGLQDTIAVLNPLRWLLVQYCGDNIIQRLLKIIKVFLSQAQSSRHRMTAKFAKQPWILGRNLIQHIAKMNAWD